MEQTKSYLHVEAIPELAETREQVRADAWAIVQGREQQIDQGQHEHLPLTIDALSTAARVEAAKHHYGENSPQHKEAYNGLFLDCHRLLAEWRRKNTAEYFPLLQHDLDADTGEYLAHGASIWQMTEDALMPMSQPEEIERRVNERVEEATAMRLCGLGGVALGEMVRMRTVSECADWSIDLLNKGATSGFGGYVPTIEKLMVRDMIIDPITGQRFEEQMGLPGTYITHDIIQRALAQRGMSVNQMNKTGLHGTQMLVEDDLIDFVELLDTVASEEWCVPIFKGEKVDDRFVKDYSTIRQEAIDRQHTLESYAHMVADFVTDLYITGTDPRQAPEVIETFVKQLLIQVAQENEPAAIEMFDQETAIGLQQVAVLHTQGKDWEALALLEQVIDAAPGGGYCGAGSCGLERIGADSKAAEDVKELGFDHKETILDKGGRKCPNCNKANVVAYDLGKKMKGCTNCKATAKY